MNLHRLRYHISRSIARCLPDKLYLSIKFRTRMGYWMDWKNPQTFCEKLQWLKVYDRHPEYTKMVDKVAAKEYVAGIIGEEYIIPTLGVYDSAEEIDFDKLPKQFVLKCTHDSGGLVVCRDKSKLDVESAREKLRRGLKRTYVIQNREYPYKHVPRRIIAEQYMEDESHHELKDYKVFCFGGEPKIIEVDYNRFEGHLRNLYTTDWLRIKATIGYPTDLNREIDRPKVLDELLNLSRKLSAGIPHVRTDFYVVDKKIFFGELTFFHGSGLEKIEPESLNRQMGDWIVLPESSDGQGGVILSKDNMFVYLRFKERVQMELVDYKMYCFNGRAEYCQVIANRSTDETIDFYDRSWTLQPFIGLLPTAHHSPTAHEEPGCYAEMLRLADRLSSKIVAPFVRIDMYAIKDHPYFGEITFFPASGLGVFQPVEWDMKLGSMIYLPA